MTSELSNQGSMPDSMFFGAPLTAAEIAEREQEHRAAQEAARERFDGITEEDAASTYQALYRVAQGSHGIHERAVFHDTLYGLRVAFPDTLTPEFVEELTQPSPAETSDPTQG